MTAQVLDLKVKLAYKRGYDAGYKHVRFDPPISQERFDAYEKGYADGYMALLSSKKENR